MLAHDIHTCIHCFNGLNMSAALAEGSCSSMYFKAASPAPTPSLNEQHTSSHSTATFTGATEGACKTEPVWLHVHTTVLLQLIHTRLCILAVVCCWR